ncbi:DUF1178 family protein [Boseongicola aestuarii]|uniref:Uncharacterized protein n=1 Tax=Boseongicola aestuarii TaxID=1470561 RepID=A0A238IZW8_9RHOB|nr:DUF1178 family protein [Boseongicola aestuarii]SMX23435.1 hypothetical protein BOA8489_01542 [Boseongicola aestuarii]
MIRYNLKCENAHQFESWFQSAEAYQSLASAGMVECPGCGSQKVEKTLMSPGVTTSRKKAATPVEAGSHDAQPVMSAPDPKMAEAMAKLRKHVEQNSDYVGSNFAKEATAMHLGDKPSRSIYGEVAPEDAKRLAEDGVPAVPLPFIPKAKTN